VASFTPQPLYPQGKSPWYTMDRKQDGLQRSSGFGGEEKNSQPLPGFEPQIIQPVAQRYSTELSRLLICVIMYLFLSLISPLKSNYRYITVFYKNSLKYKQLKVIFVLLC
jgi:hypothetical protein